MTYQQVPHGGQDFALSFTFLKLEEHPIIFQNENVWSRILILCLRAFLDLGGVVVVIIKKTFFAGAADLPT